MLRKAAILALVLVLTGCSIIGEQQLEKLAQDPASLCASGEAAYVGQGKLRLCRANAPGTKVTMAPDGSMTLERTHEPPKMAEVDKQAITLDTIAGLQKLLQETQRMLKAVTLTPLDTSKVPAK